MNEHDLHAAFGDLARRGTEEQTERMRHGDGLSAERVTAVAHRTRRRRAALTTAAGLVVLGGTAVAGTALVDTPAPPQPAAPTPSVTAPAVTPSPSPSPERTDVPLAAGDPSLVLGACGSVLGGPTDLPLDDRWTVSFSADAEVPLGHGLPVSTRLDVNLPGDWSPIGIGYGAYPGTGPEFLVVRDGVVVGTTDLYGDVVAPLDWYTAAAAAHSAAFVGTLPLTSCTDGRPLPPGAYELVGTMRVLPLGDDDAVAEEIRVDGVEAVAEQRGDEWRRVLSAPQPFSVVDDGTPLPERADGAIDEAAFVPAPVCGQPSTPSAGSMITLSAQPPASTTVGAAPDVPATVTFAGPGRLRTTLQVTAGFWAVQDGVVVAGPPASTDVDHARVDLGAGVSVPVPGPLDLRACAGGYPGDEPLGPGTYTVVPAVALSGIQVRGVPDGIREFSPHAFPAVTGEAFPLVVE